MAENDKPLSEQDQRLFERIRKTQEEMRGAVGFDAKKAVGEAVVRYWQTVWLIVPFMDSLIAL